MQGNVDFVSIIFRPVDVMSVAGFEDEVLQLMREKDIRCQTYIRDVEELVAEDRERFRAQRARAAETGEFNLTIYHDYYEVGIFVQSFARAKHVFCVYFTDYGASGRPRQPV